MSGEPCSLWGFLRRIRYQENDCWIWQGRFYPEGRKGEGYGKFSGTMAHRFGYERLVGPVPKELHLDHLCRVRACVNPAHLEPVTPAENNRRSPTCVATIHATATHCAQGHPFDEENTRRVKSGKRKGKRVCRTCSIEASRAYRRRRKQAA